jgi:hypothetical protein
MVQVRAAACGSWSMKRFEDTIGQGLELRLASRLQLCDRDHKTTLNRATRPATRMTRTRMMAVGRRIQ